MRSDFFYEKTWVRFSPKLNIELLLGSDNGLFYRQKEITFRALAAWLITGRTTTITKNAICLGMIAALAEAEAELREKQSAAAIIYMAVPLVTENGFFERAYSPIGGVATLARASSVRRHGEALRYSERTLRYSLEMMRVLHVAHELWVKDGRYGLSASKAADMVSKVLRLPGCPTPHRLSIQWRRFHKRIALLYSASNIWVAENATLLDEMMRGSPSFELCEDHLVDWLAKARYVLGVLDGCPDPANGAEGLFDANRRRMPRGTDISEFPAEHGYSRDDLQKMEVIFARRSGNPGKMAQSI